MQYLEKLAHHTSCIFLLSILCLPACALIDASGDASAPNDVGSNADADAGKDTQSGKDTGPDATGCAPGYAGETCEKCENGTYCAGGDAPKVSCADRNGWYSEQNPSEPCTDWTVCADNEIVAQAGSSFADRLCLPCDEGKTSAGPNASECVVAFDMVSAGNGFACGVRSADSRYICWGDLEGWNPRPDESTLKFKTVSVGSLDTCGILADNDKLKCWNDTGAAAIDPQFDTGITAETPGLKFSALSVGRYHACGLTTGSSAYCWGEDHYGSVWDRPFDTLFSSISVAWYQSCGIEKETGKLICWGDTPAYPGPSNTVFHSVSVGLDFVCGVQGDQHYVQCWDENGYKSDGGFDQMPAEVAFKSVSSGGSHACAIPIENDRGVSCWGYNATHVGQVEGAPSSGNFKSVSVGQRFSCAIRAADSKVVCWGNNNWGQVGDAP